MNKQSLRSLVKYIAEKYADVDYMVEDDLYESIDDWKAANFKLSRTLPSNLQLGENCKILFLASDIEAQIIKVHFTESSVFYDVEIKGKYPISSEDDPGARWTQRLYNISGAFISK